MRGVVAVVRTLRKDGDEPFLLCQLGESAVTPDHLGTAAIAMKYKDKGRALRDGIRSVHIIGTSDAVVFEIELSEYWRINDHH